MFMSCNAKYRLAERCSTVPWCKLIRNSLYDYSSPSLSRTVQYHGPYGSSYKLVEYLHDSYTPTCHHSPYTTGAYIRGDSRGVRRPPLLQLHPLTKVQILRVSVIIWGGCLLCAMLVGDERLLHLAPRPPRLAAWPELLAADRTSSGGGRTSSGGGRASHWSALPLHGSARHLHRAQGERGGHEEGT